MPADSDTESDYSSSSEDVTEDEFGDELTPALDAAILQTLGKIRRKEGVYAGENVLQEALKEAESKAGKLGVTRLQKVVADKPYLLADHHREALLRGQVDEDEEEETEDLPLTNVQQQRLLRQEAISAFHTLAEGSDAEDEDEDEAGFALKKREEDVGDAEADAEEYRQFLLEIGGGEDEVRKILNMGDQPAWEPEVSEETSTKKTKKEKKKSALSEVEREEMQKKKASADDDFLMNYILNRGWIDRAEKHVPTYTEIVGQDAEEGGDDAGPSHPWGELDEDEFDEKAEEFETAYNFRYEEPGAENILTHPRNIATLARRTDDTRKTKREARNERKAAEKAAKEEETRRLKGQKRREMEAQIAELKKELGEDMDWAALEKIMDGEWDEAEWERVVGSMLSAAAEREDNEKPQWDDLEDAEYDEPEDAEDGDFEYGGVPVIEEAYDQEEDQDDEGPINMDADFIDAEPIKKSKKNKKGKAKERAVEVEKDLTAAQRAEKVKQTMNEYQKLDHEDMIGDLPTRFKYTKSAPVDFGLTPVEILLATDAELNALAGVKHIAPYRRGGMGKAGFGLGKRVRELKAQLRHRSWDAPSSQSQGKHKFAEGSGANADKVGVKRKWGGENGEKYAGDQPPAAKKKRLGKKQRLRAKAAETEQDGESSAQAAKADEKSTPVAVVGADGGEKKKRRKRRKSEVIA